MMSRRVGRPGQSHFATVTGLLDEPIRDPQAALVDVETAKCQRLGRTKPRQAAEKDGESEIRVDGVQRRHRRFLRRGETKRAYALDVQWADQGLSSPASTTARTPARAGAIRRAEAARLVVSALCVAVVLVQLVGLMLWSARIVASSSLTWDFAIYYQPWYLIAHGHLLPRNTLQGGYLFVRNDGEFIVYLLAPLYWLFPDHQLGYLWLQDLAVAGVSATCLAIVCESLPWRVSDPARTRAIAALTRVLVVLLVVANPFVYKAASFDIHMEIFGACFAMLLLRAVLQKRRSAAAWALLTALCGTASLLYLVAVGLCGCVVLLWRYRRARRDGRRAAGDGGDALLSAEHRPSLLLALWPIALSELGVDWLLVLAAMHATQGSPAYAYVYLAPGHAVTAPTLGQVAEGILEHPVTAFDVVRSHAWNLWANTSPDGFVGLFSPAVFLVVLALLPNNLIHGQAFSAPDFQNFVVYGAVALGSVAVVAALLRRRLAWPVGAILALATAFNAAGWFHAWFPSVRAWVRVSPGASAVVRQVEREAAPGDEVVASQGFVGVLAGRAQVDAFLGPSTVAIRSRTVWFVLSDSQGIQTATTAETLEAIETVASLPGVRVIHGGGEGIWVFRWHPRPGVRTLHLGDPGSHYPIWMFPIHGEVSLTSGAVSSWGLATKGRTSVLIAGDEFQLAPGNYVATVRVDCDRPVTVEVWDDDDTEPQLAWVRATPRRPEDVRTFFEVAGSDRPGPGVVVGSGVFRYLSGGALPLVPIELRVFVPPGASARAWWTSVSPVAAAY